MVFIASWLVLSIAAVLMRMVAARILRVAFIGRFILTTGPPAAMAAFGAWLYFSKPRSSFYPAEWDTGLAFVELLFGWKFVFVLRGLMAGAAAAVAVLPMWFLLEQKFGGRAR